MLRAEGVGGRLLLDARRGVRPVDGSTGWRKPPRSRYAHASAGAGRENTLRASLPERRASHDHRSIMVLQRASDNFRGAGAAGIDQHDQRKVRPLLRRRVAELFGGARAAPAHRDDHLRRVEEHVGHTDALRQHTARVPSQVHNE
jgi:hypothetical protein